MERIASASPAVERVRASLAALGLNECPIKTFETSTATALDAAAAIGTSVERIVKSLVFVAGAEPILVLVSGPQRVDVQKLASLTGRKVRRASAEEVRAATGYAIGGVPPIGHAQMLTTYLDRNLLAHDELWAAAGTPNAVFSIAPADLERITRAQVVDLVEL